MWSIGTKKICGFYDLANTRKLLADDSGYFGCWYASGHCGELGPESPLATLRYDDERNYNYPNSVGWIVRDVEKWIKVLCLERLKTIRRYDSPNDYKGE